MRIVELPMDGVFLLEMEPHEDERGSFARCFCSSTLMRLGIGTRIAQANLSRSSSRHTLRGLHYQHAPFEETKIVQCVAGRIYDVVLDLRPSSPTFSTWFAAEISADNGRIMVVPEGCAHGFMTLEDDSVVHYLVSAAYSPLHEDGVRHDDPAFAIRWPAEPACMSPRDRAHPLFDLERQLPKVSVPA